MPLVKKAERVIARRIRELCGTTMGLSLSLTLIDDEEMAPLHEQWLGKKGPTDVLSFSALEDGSFRADLLHGAVGDIIISVDTIQRQAKKHRWGFEKELAKMFVHGFLHIFGYDHATLKEKREMDSFAKQILL